MGGPGSGKSFGSIPACAGKPSWPWSSAAFHWVYPRVCGEAVGNPFKALGKRGVYPRVCGEAPLPQPPTTAIPGLSPRVRGSLVGWLVGWVWPGSIPACAGKPQTFRVRVGRVRVYPRVCGEAVPNGVSMTLRPGLSPRVRGSRVCGRRRLPWRRSIPACAGKPCRRRRANQGNRVYPRVCGEAPDRDVSQRRREGLSPRVRGSPPIGTVSTGTIGSIPACAGKP